MKKKYNLLIITPDQMRADYLSSYGHPTINTANLSNLAKKGIQFEHCYCSAPLCGPSRISFATSTYLSEHNHREYSCTISPDVPNIVTSLKKNGYRTGMFGKNHLFTVSRLKEVWDELDFIGLGNYDVPKPHELYKHSYSSFELEKDHRFNITGRLTDEIIDFMDKTAEPFLAWVNYQDPHPAYTCPEPYYSLFNWEDIKLSEAFYKYDKDKQPIRNEVWRQHSEMYKCTEEDMKRATATYMGQIRYVDDSVGRMMKYLEESGRDKDTIVLFFSDHGELLGDYRMTHKLPSFYDCLTRIPTILYHPDLGVQDFRFKGLVEEVDLAPTLLSLLGIEIPPTMVGKSLAEDIVNRDDTGKETLLCEAGIGEKMWTKADPNLKLLAPGRPTPFGAGSMIRYKNYKLSIYAEDRCELYDLDKDPMELNNVYDNKEYQEIKDNMTLMLLKRVLNVKCRNTGKLEWDYEDYKIDVRKSPLE